MSTFKAQADAQKQDAEPAHGERENDGSTVLVLYLGVALEALGRWYAEVHASMAGDGPEVFPEGRFQKASSYQVCAVKNKAGLVHEHLGGRKRCWSPPSEQGRFGQPG